MKIRFKIILAVIMTMFAAVNAAAATEPTVDEDGYYAVYDAYQLYWAVQHNMVSGSSLVTKIKLMRDIVVNDGVMTAESTDAIPWEPIGGVEDVNSYSSSANFRGIIDGQGHYISGLYCKNSCVVGLVAYNHGTIKNLGIINSYFYGPASEADSKHYAYAGTFAGINKDGGVIENCYCYNNTIDSEYMSGGICGKLSDNSTVKNCYVSNDVTSSQTSVSGRKKYADAIGARPEATATVSNTYYDSSKTFSWCTYSSDNPLCSAAAFTPDQLSSGELTYLLNERVSSSDSVWRQNLTCGDRDFLPVLDSTHYIVYNEGGEYVNHEEDIISSDDPLSLEPNASGVYELHNADQLYAFARLVNEYPENKGLCAALKEDIVISYERLTDQNAGARAWEPIGTVTAPYVGKFDGEMHTISGMYFDNVSNEQNYEGFIGFLGQGGVVKNLGIINSYSYASDSAGIIASQCYSGTIQNCFSRYNVIKSENNAGGIVGTVLGVSVREDLVCVDCMIYSDSDKGEVGGILGGFSGSQSESRSSVNDCYYYRLDDLSNINTKRSGVMEIIKGDVDLNGVVDLRDAISSAGKLDMPLYTFTPPEGLAADLNDDDYVDYGDAFDLLVIVSGLEGQI